MATREPRWAVLSAEQLDLENGPDESWYVVCRHGSLLGMARKAEATSYRAYLWASRRAGDPEAVAELCVECSLEVPAA